MQHLSGTNVKPHRYTFWVSANIPDLRHPAATKTPCLALCHSSVKSASRSSHPCTDDASPCICPSVSSGIEVALVCGFKASFPATGSGLLWARSTGLKVWDGAKVLSQLLLLPNLGPIVAILPALRRGLQQEHSSGSCATNSNATGGGSGARSSDGANSSRNGNDRHGNDGTFGICNESVFGLQGCTVIELGAGLGLCSVAAAHMGAEVIATDGDADLVRLLKKNLAFNNGEVALTAAQLRQQRVSSALGQPDNKQRPPTGSQKGGQKRRFHYAPRACILPWGDEQAVQNLRASLLSCDSGGRVDRTDPSGLLSDLLDQQQQEGLPAHQQHQSRQRQGDGQLQQHNTPQQRHHQHQQQQLQQPQDSKQMHQHHHAPQQQQQHHHHHQQLQQPQGSKQSHQHHHTPQQHSSNQGHHRRQRHSAPDVVIMAEVVYGSDPGVWEKLISTLKHLCSSRTLILQAESRRIEGVLYGEYWAMLAREGFDVVEVTLPDLLGEDLGLGHKDPYYECRATDEAQQQLPTGDIPYSDLENGGSTIVQQHETDVLPRVRAWAIHKLE